MEPYDAVVVGAGHNGLTCAAYLARAGLRTIVLERAERAGGACVTDEPWPGYRVPGAAYALSLLLPEVVDELGLDLDVRALDPQLFAPLDDGGGLFVWRDRARTVDGIARLSQSDARGYAAFDDLFGDAAARLTPLLTYPATRAHVRRAFRKSEHENLFARTVTGSIAEVCEQHFETDALRGLVASQGVTGTSAGPRTPGTAYVYLHHATGRAAGARGAWGFVRGGMGAVADALEGAARAAGAEIRTGAEVARVDVRDGRRAAGVVLASGEEIEARAVCSNADPRRTVSLVPAGTLPPEFVEDVDLLPASGTVVKVDLALGALPRWRGMGRDAGPEHRGLTVVAPSIDYLEDACRAAAGGEPAPAMACEVALQSATEDGLAPAGKHVMTVLAQYAPYDLARGTWGERRDEVGELVLTALERHAPGLTELVEHRRVLGPPDLEARFGLTGGHVFHGEVLPDWSFDARPSAPWHRYRTPLPGLYLCGAGAHPGGGVSGAPGRNAARAVLSDRVARGD
ncbi:MAG TPA: NAD(P)/FAD-dependent oxidoreductase [Actinomycetota bacterium]|nr:NAD(P)/FAD-dependent oxidoreductase [Actinomycetota bacterium]